MKINVARKYFGQLIGHGVRDASLVCGLKEGGANASTRHLKLCLVLGFRGLHFKARRAFLEGQAVEVVGVFVGPPHDQLFQVMRLIRACAQ